MVIRSSPCGHWDRRLVFLDERLLVDVADWPLL
jgi:hypothetical protein